jgi:uncharacterized protein YfaS (alpha-2-macroglobulin family)
LLPLVALALLMMVRPDRLHGAEADTRATAQQQMKNGNWKDADAGFEALARAPKTDPLQVGEDLTQAITCLQNLGREEEIDAFRDAVIVAHARNWRLLSTAARTYLDGEHNGFLIAGAFNRGGHRGGGNAMNAYDRDRVRALQLMVQASTLLDGAPGSERGEFYWHFSEMLLGNRGADEAWSLQSLTDLSVLPDYQQGYRYGGRGRYYDGNGAVGAPVAADGTPVYYHVPQSWAAARNDGERWRWTLQQTMEADASRSCEVQFCFADFLHTQFGVQTMAGGGYRSLSDSDGKVDESGPYAVQTLAEHETIARLATGIKRFTLPDEFNCIKIFQQVAQGKGDIPTEALRQLGQIFEDRREYDRAVEYWRQAGETDRVKQITDNWGEFEPVMTQPAGQGATVDFRFRNAKRVHFTAQAIDIEKLLTDVKDYITSHPQQLDWSQMDISNVGYQLVTKNQTKYLHQQVAAWDLELSPRANHFDRRITVTTPLQQAGAYLLTGTLQDGNISRIVLWVADTAIIKKPLDQQAYYYVADAVHGQPLAKVNLEFFGYRQNWIENSAPHTGHEEITTRNFAEFTDANGQLMLQPEQQPQAYQWIVIARAGKRLAFLGFSNVWYSARYDAQYSATKTFLITDRPVYRPEQKVQFKLWMNQAQYDREGKSPYAGHKVLVRISNPKGDKVNEQTLIADDYGGVNGEFTLDKDATLGMYQIELPNMFDGGGSFRVEEYKKPEFEVTVDAPSTPVMLGEKITATIKANYLFGEPVTEATVKYKILRSAYDGNWYPPGRWDWFYGPGYWWFAADEAWYPHWSSWGCVRPTPIWWQRPQAPPEVVAEAEAPIGPDGTVKVVIDTALAKAIHGDTDHRYEITAEVTDRSRRTIVGQGTVLVARQPFKVYAWVDRGHYRVGDVIQADFRARTLDSKPVQGTGELKLYKITYQQSDRTLVPVEAEVQHWDVPTDADGHAHRQLKASEAGQYRLSYTVTDSAGHRIEGGYLLNIRGAGFDGSQYRFNALELIPDKREYQPGDTVQLMLNTNRAGATVLLFLRPTDGVYLPPQVLHLTGKSTVVAIPVTKKDMPNFFVEAVTVYDGKVYSETREIVVPPEQRVLTVRVLPSASTYLPGAKANVGVTVTDAEGKPFHGSAVVSIYDKAVEYISGGSNVPDIKEFFWKWRRSHYPRTESSLDKGNDNLLREGETPMADLGVFGRETADLGASSIGGFGGGGGMRNAGVAMNFAAAAAPPAGAAGMLSPRRAHGMLKDAAPRPMMTASQGMLLSPPNEGMGTADQSLVQPTVRSNFADTALWVGSLETDARGHASVSLTMPDSLTTWKARVWTMGDGTRVGEGTAEIITRKNLILRMQAPRFFVQKDEVVLSANVHNYLKTAKEVTVSLEAPELLQALDKTTVKVQIPANGETRVDWRVKVLQTGQAVIRMKALTDEESDAMQQTFPVYVHGMLKTESFSGAIRPEGTSGKISFTVPAARQPEQSRLEVRYSPTLAGAMVDALPYLVEYPYGCTEQTLNRFLPTVLTQHTLLRMGVHLRDIQEKRTNLNAQQIGDDRARAQDWARMEQDMRGAPNPVFDEDAVNRMVKAGLERLAAMQCADGGWGWFSGWGEQSYPHTTALVVHGMQLARANGVALLPDVFDRGVAWLHRYQQDQVTELQLWDKTHKQGKEQADALDAFVYMVLVDEKQDNTAMRDYLYRDRTELPVYAKALFGLALDTVGDTAKRDMLIQNIDQYLVQDNEDQTAYLRLPERNWWWCWYGSDTEADAYYLKLLTRTDPHGVKASRLVKYLLNNRANASYWKSTRDTAIVVESFADYLAATGEAKPDLTVQVCLDGKMVKTVHITAENLFSFDNQFVLTGDHVTTGPHTLELRKEGTGAFYFNAYLTNFTLEDPIKKAGLEIKVTRQYFKLTPIAATATVEGAHGQAVDQRVEKYRREPLPDLATLKSGDLLEVQLTIESKNDYEYILFADPKPAGCESVALRSGYGDNEMGAYMELHDNRTCFFVRALARGTQSISYRLRAEIPGQFSALPATAAAMYAPELKANSDEGKIRIED